MLPSNGKVAEQSSFKGLQLLTVAQGNLLSALLALRPNKAAYLHEAAF